MAYAPYIDERNRTVTEVLLALDYDRAALEPFSYLVLSREGSRRFLQGPYDMERANLADLKARPAFIANFPPILPNRITSFSFSNVTDTLSIAHAVYGYR